MKEWKCLKTAAAAVLLSIMMTVSAFAATGKLSFSDPTVDAGAEVNVTMKIAAEGEAKLSDATVTISYDPAMLEFVAGTDADGGAGTVRVHGASNGAGTGVLEYNLKFKTLAAGQSALTVNTQEIYDDAGQVVELSHTGSSTVTASAGEEVSSNADLSAFEIVPGTLSPAFSPEVTSYETTVDTSVDQLSINALPADGGANVILSGNEGLQIGDNTITVTVTAADGQTRKEYTLLVHKTEGGDETQPAETTGAEGETESQATETENSGVQLSSKGKTITIMNPGSDVQIPEGFKSGTILIDGQRVQGWVWGADTEDPKYCVVYGMNDQGELSFYRYDLTEKTIQRYFEDPLAAGSVSGQEYTDLQNRYNQLVEDYDMRFLVICILALIGVILLATVIYLFAKLKAAQRPETKRRHEAQQETAAQEPEEVYDGSILQHDYEETEPQQPAAMDETQVLKRPQSRRRGAKNMEDTMPISGAEPKQKEETASRAEQPAEKKEGAASGKDPEDDEFDTFNI